MNRYVLMIIIAVAVSSCRSQDRIIQSITCGTNVNVQYEKADAEARKEGLVADENLKSFVVHFLSDFDGKVKGYVNDEVLFNKYIKTNEVTDKTDEYFGYDYSDDEQVPILKISTGEQCFDIKIDKDYKLIYVYRTDNQGWIVRFSNIHYAEH
ncbi:hypothetical protein DSM03_10212 [Leeuwenhoekiella aestuarii]|uniref:hypothetical protein n=1 Tax=Leeuwenhoekiella aestuarii TaxID=2249426 RepID=UPI000FFEC1E3|nr:hypothetical protein [Leeuwenhoekiella aestuarii]RXG17137.1 hypothetical protein DSM03_10212 [Leeuwenhoekiella aestuarii]